MTNKGRRYVTSLAGLVLLALVVMPMPVAAQQSAGPSADCNTRFPEPITVIKVAADHRGLVTTRDGCWMFTGYLRRPDVPGTGVGVLRRAGHTFEEVRFVPVPGNPNNPFGLALTHDQKILVVSHTRQVSFFDVQKLTSGQGDPLLGQVSGPRIQYSFGVSVTPDDRYAFVAQGALASVIVIDLEKGRTSGFDASALVGVIPGVFRPSLTTLSPDGRYLYFPNKQPPDVVSPSLTCAGGKQAEGAVQIVDAQRARSDAASATVGFVSPAGCEPTVATVSPDGARLSVVAPGVPDVLSTQGPSSDPLLTVFALRDGKTATLLGKVRLPGTPGLAVDSGTRIIVGLVGGLDLVVIDPSKASMGEAAIVGRIPVATPTVALGPDGHTLFALVGSRNGGDTRLVVVDLDRAPVQPTTK